MARKQKAPPEKPSKAYLVSFGDTMTALLAFFIVLNSFAKDQTGANMYTGTGSFVNAVSSIGLPGGYPNDRSGVVNQKKAPSPIYAVEGDKNDDNSRKRHGPDENPDRKRIIDRQTENFKRFLNNMSKEFDVQEEPPTKSQIVFDSFEKLRRLEKGKDYLPLGKEAIQIASESIMKLGRPDFELEIIVWADMPSQLSLKTAMEKAMAIQNQIDSIFTLTFIQKARFKVSAKPWLFVDAARPKVSFVLSKLDLSSPQP